RDDVPVALGADEAARRGADLGGRDDRHALVHRLVRDEAPRLAERRGAPRWDDEDVRAGEAVADLGRRLPADDRELDARDPRRLARHVEPLLVVVAADEDRLEAGVAARRLGRPRPEV